MRVTNLVRNPDFMDYIILGRYDQPLTISFRDRKLIVHIIPFENRRQILVTHDVTETERIEEMRRDFIANASHELRTPLTVIVASEIAAQRRTGCSHPRRPPQADDGAGPPHAAPDRGHADPVAPGIGGLPAAPDPVDGQADGASAARRARPVGRQARDHHGVTARRAGQLRRTAQRLRQPGLERRALHAGRRQDHPALAGWPGRTAIHRGRYRHRHQPGTYLA
jgi:signal transduction histidine kinase